MPAQTAHGYPYPIGTDPIGNGAATTQQLAQKVESQLKQLASGTGNLTIPIGSSNADVLVPYGVTFPSAPVVVASARNAAERSVAADSETTTQFRIRVARPAGSSTTATMTVFYTWLAHG